jgi:VWFA-related protein
MRLAVVTLGVLFAGSTIALAQQPGQPPATFRAGTALVDFTIVALDENGGPVSDLRMDEIIILEDDQSRDVAFFQFEGAAPADAATTRSPDALPPGTFTNQTEFAPGAPRQLVAIVLDFVNASPVEQMELRAQFLHYLKQIPSEAHVGLYLLRDRAVAVHDYTQDAGSLRDRIEKGEPGIFERALASTVDSQKLLAGASPDRRGSLAAMLEADTRAVEGFNVHILRERRQKTLSALDSVGAHLAGLPGRKSLVWISHGFPLTSNLEASYVDEVRGTSQRLASHDVAIYPVDARGLPAYRASPLTMGRIEGTSELMASITGGRVTRNNNDLTLGLAAAAEDSRGTYSVGFYAVADPDNRWHRLTVRTLRPGLSLRHREGYLAAATPADQFTWSEEQWNEMASRPLTSTAVRFKVRPTLVTGGLKLALEVVPEDLQFRRANDGQTAELDIALVERSGAGPTNVRVNSASVQLSAGITPSAIPLEAEFRLNPQTSSVRVIVRDKASGKLGSVDLPLHKPPKQ